MDPKEYTTLWEALADIPDPRKPKGVRYRWQMLLMLIAAAMISGQQHGRAIGQWVSEHSETLNGLLGRVPSESTLRRVLRVVDIGELEDKLSRLAGMDERAGLVRLAIDGKELRGARAHDSRKVHLVGLVDHSSGEVLSEVSVAEKNSELATAPKLIEGRTLTGAVITVDALLAQRSLARQILERGGDYLMVVKQNQPQTKQSVEDLFGEAIWQALIHKPYWRHKSYGKGHGRLEERMLESTTDANQYLMQDLDWPKIGQVMRRTTRRVRLSTGEISQDVSYAINSSRPSQAGPDQLERLWRGHWSIENRVHYVRDVTLGGCLPGTRRKYTASDGGTKKHPYWADSTSRLAKSSRCPPSL